eukprot:1137934-Pyramimonas_sp.AAC.1
MRTRRLDAPPDDVARSGVQGLRTGRLPRQILSAAARGDAAGARPVGERSAPTKRKSAMTSAGR